MTDEDLAPDIRRFQQALAAGYAEHPPLDGLTLPELRRITEAVRAPFVRGGPTMAQTETLSIPCASPECAPHGPLRLRVHRPSAAANLPALVYLHGGGWVFFSIDTHDRLMREIAAGAGRVVVGVEYARAPEARFPVALQQTVAAWRWVRSQAEVRGIDPRRIALGGDSVGANLALAAALSLRDGEAGAQPDALLLNYGAFTDDDSGESFDLFDGPRYTLGRDEMRGFWAHYLRDAADRADPLAVPLKAELAGLPRCCLVVAECDVLRDGNLAMAERLRAAGVPTRLQRHAGTTHSFLEAMAMSVTAQRALQESCAWLREEAP